MQTVIKADFLNLTVTEDHSHDDADQSPQKMAPGIFQRSSFAIVVFSLLLSYFPAPAQRLKCCCNAFHMLRPHGILLIVTPDSSHQNKNMKFIKSWQCALEGLGFSKWKYEKRRHLHCIAFRKCHEQMLVSEEEAMRCLAPYMCILQDSQSNSDSCTDFAMTDKTIYCETDNTEPISPASTSCTLLQLPGDVQINSECSNVL